MSTYVKEATAPHAAAAQIAADRDHMARMRHLNERQPEADARAKRWPYKKAVVIIFDGVQLSPDRAVLEEWQTTPYDQRTTFREDRSRPPGQQLDCGDGFGVLVRTGGPFKVRSLHWPTIGEVKAVDSALTYWLIKTSEMNRTTPLFEPVPPATELRDPIFPKNFPSSSAKARSQAAKGLRKPADDLTFQQILDYFRSKKSSLESFAG